MKSNNADSRAMNAVSKLAELRVLRMLCLAIILSGGPLITQAFAANHYVRAGASGDGSDWSNAYPSLPTMLVRGDTYYVADGTYGSYTFDDPISGTSLIKIRKATPTDHGADTGWSDSYGDGEALFKSSGTVFTVRTGYYEVDGVVGKGKAPGTFGFRLQSTASRDSATIMMLFEDGVNNLAFKHIDFDWNNGTASGSSAVTRHIYTTGASSNVLIDSCYFHHSSGYVFYIGPYNPDPTGPLENNYTIKNNYFYMNGGGGSDSAHWETMWLMNFDNSNILNNVVQDTIGSSGQTGWVMFAKSDKTNVSGNLFFCADSRCIVGGNGVVATWSSDSYKNNSIHVYNNTFANLRGVYTPQIYFVHNSVSDTDIQVKNNLYYNATFNWAGINIQSNESCGGGQPCSGSNQQTGVKTTQFANYSGNDFRLLSATASGDSSIGSAFAIDMSGTTRGSDGLWDRGAYEFGPQSAQVQPPSNLQVTVQ